MEIVSFTSPDSRIRLNVHFKLIEKFNAVEYFCELENICRIPTSIVENFQSLALQCSTEFIKSIGHGGQNREVRIRRNFGTVSNFSDFTAQPATLYPLKLNRTTGNFLSMSSSYNCSAAEWLPYFGIDFDSENGLIAGIGWSGAWRADFNLSQDGVFSAFAGLSKTHFRMLPGEKLRMPSILLAFREKESVECAQNRFRRMLFEEYSPKDAGGSRIPNAVCFAVYGGISTDIHLQYLDIAKKWKWEHDLYGIDAAWYGEGTHENVFTGTWYSQAGNWWVNAVHPAGLTPITKAARNLDKNTWLWFEIERASIHTKVVQEHPEWFIGPSKGSMLLNLGDDDALAWAVETTAKILVENGITQLHQDFNMNSLEALRAQDSPDRIGIAEIKYNAGLQDYWDKLLEFVPGLRIDHCAGGGRRMDFETLKRGHVLWRSDVQCWPDFDPIQNQIQNFYLHEWVANQAGGVNLVPGDDYGFFSAVSTGLTDTTFIYAHTAPQTDYDFKFHSDRIREAIKMRPYFTGDYYPLTVLPEIRENWCAYQFHCGEKGLILAFRRPESPEESLVLRPREILPDVDYELEFLDGEREKIIGDKLENYTVSLPRRGVKVIYYAKIQK